MGRSLKEICNGIYYPLIVDYVNQTKNVVLDFINASVLLKLLFTFQRPNIIQVKIY